MENIFQATDLYFWSTKKCARGSHSKCKMCWKSPGGIYSAIFTSIQTTCLPLSRQLVFSCYAKGDTRKSTNTPPPTLWSGCKTPILFFSFVSPFQNPLISSWTWIFGRHTSKCVWKSLERRWQSHLWGQPDGKIQQLKNTSCALWARNKTFRALKSPGILFLKKYTNPVLRYQLSLALNFVSEMPEASLNSKKDVTSTRNNETELICQEAIKADKR